jgi:glutamate--cysteine ligase
MARDQIDMTPIASRDELVAWFEAGCKPKSAFRIGTEHEKFPFTLDGNRPVPYEGRRGIRALLEGMQHLLGWEPITENGNIIGLFDVTGGRSRSSPAGFEPRRAGRGRIRPFGADGELRVVKQVAAPLGIGWPRHDPTRAAPIFR